MLKYFLTFISLLVFDAGWLGFSVSRIYAPAYGSLMTNQPVIWAVALFYLLYPIAIIYLTNGNLKKAAVLGFIAYATYNLTNLAIIKNWPVNVSLIDIAWGTLVTTLSVGVSEYLMQALTKLPKYFSKSKIHPKIKRPAKR